MLALQELEVLIGLVSEKKLSTVDDDNFNYWEEIETHLEEEYGIVEEEYGIAFKGVGE